MRQRRGDSDITFFPCQTSAPLALSGPREDVLPNARHFLFPATNSDFPLFSRVLNLNLERHYLLPDKEIVKSKDLMTMHIGFRRFTARCKSPYQTLDPRP